MFRNIVAIGFALLSMGWAAACSRNSDYIDGPEAQLLSLSPSLVCTEQIARSVEISGEGLAPLIIEAAKDVQAVLPSLYLLRSHDLQGEAVSGEAEIQIPPSAVSWQSQSAMQAVLGPALELTAGLYRLRAHNEAGAESSLAGALLVVNPPRLESVAPDLLCLEQAGAELVLSGEGFIDDRGALPVVQIGDLLISDPILGQCQDLAGAVAGVRICKQLTVSLPQAALAPGAHALAVTNPSTVDCVSEQNVTIAVVAAPAVDAVEPDLFCGDQEAVELSLHGAGFLSVAGVLPLVELAGLELAAGSLSDCNNIEGTLLDAQSCAGLSVTVPAGSLNESGLIDLGVRNPAPAACTLTVPEAFFHLSAPAISRVSTVVACDANATELIVLGSGFLVQAGDPPSVRVNDIEATVTAVGDCAPLADLANAELCARLDISVPAGTISLGDHTVVVTNLTEIACSASAIMHIDLPPTISAVAPLELCSSGGTITVSGERFFDGAVVSIGQGSEFTNLETSWIDNQTVEALVPDPTEPGLYDVTLTNADGCAHTLVGALDIAPLPVVFFVDPPNLYSGVNIQVTVYASGILGAVAGVRIYPSGAPAAAIDLTYTYVEASRIQALVPAGLDPGAYDIEVIDDLGCLGSLIGAFMVTQDLSVTIERVELPFGWTDARTGVNIYAPASPPVDSQNFAPTPRFYLNPSAAGDGTLASELNHVSFVSAERVSAVVPAGLSVGHYDLIAVNPDGGIGLLAEAFEVTTLPPPRIEALSPASVVNQDLQEVTVLGENFRAPTVAAICLQPDDSTVTLVGDLISSGASSLLVEFDFVSQSVQDGTVCIIKVTNDDDTYARYSALGITNPSLNLEFFSATAAMQVARRAPCAAAANAADGARFVYAVGGDDGNSQDSVAGQFYDSIEMAAIDPYGELSSFSLLPNRLPAARSFHACATIGRYLFVAGGSDDAGASQKVWRAKVLDPALAPIIEDVDLRVVDGAALLDPGRYSYRVSALRPLGDSDNPGGESLASDSLSIQTPAIDQRLEITIHWTEVLDSVGYRIYRSPTANLAGGTEVLIGEVAGNTLSFTDDGSATPGSAQAMPLGAMGVFYPLPDLLSAREGAAMAVASDPVDDSIRYLYLLGGRDAGGTGLASIERLRVQLDSEGKQSLDPLWLANSENIGPARWQLQAYVANEQSAGYIVAPGESWIYAGGGLRDDLLELVPDMVALLVEAGGELGASAGARYVVDTMQPYRAGYAGAIFNNQIFAFGGSQAEASLESSSIEMCGIITGACSAAIPDPPDLANWNNLGIDLTVARYLSAGVTVSAFIFLLGGIDDSQPAVPLAATEKTLW